MVQIAAAAEIEQRLQQMAAEIKLQIPGAEVRLFGSRARGMPLLIPISIC